MIKAVTSALAKAKRAKAFVDLFQAFPLLQALEKCPDLSLDSGSCPYTAPAPIPSSALSLAFPNAPLTAKRLTAGDKPLKWTSPGSRLLGP